MVNKYILQGRILWYGDVTNCLVVTDIDSFIDIIQVLRNRSLTSLQRNGNRCLSLSPDIPLYDNNALNDLLPGIPSDKVSYHILGPNPCSQVNKVNFDITGK